MSERDPLLPAPPQPTSRYRKWQRKLAQFLESPRLHKIVLTLISIDAACVLADLTYSFLSPTCETPGEEGSPTWLLVLSQISLVITTLFLIEIPISLWAFGPKHLNPWGPVPHAGLHVFDALIILTTFTGEVVLRGKEREIAGLLVFLRLWRLVKLVGGVAVGAGELQEELVEELAELKTELSRTKTKLVELQEENASLKQQLMIRRPTQPI